MEILRRKTVKQVKNTRTGYEMLTETIEVFWCKKLIIARTWFCSRHNFTLRLLRFKLCQRFRAKVDVRRRVGLEVSMHGYIISITRAITYCLTSNVSVICEYAFILFGRVITHSRTNLSLYWIQIPIPTSRRFPMLQTSKQITNINLKHFIWKVKYGTLFYISKHIAEHASFFHCIFKANWKVFNFNCKDD